MKSSSRLIYIHDPMCSWCYGFKPVLTSLSDALKDKIEINYLLGGLAKDTDSAMPEIMQQQIKENWRNIEQTIPGIKFNYDFWSQCIPRRSTYASCRAVIAAKIQRLNAELKMINTIQQAYYSNAQNPSDYSVLYSLATKIGLDIDQFKRDIHSDAVNNELLNQISKCRIIGASTFPSLYVSHNDDYYPIVLDYNNVDIIIEHISSYI